MEKTLTKSEFEDQANIKTQYDRFRDERGDACGFYSDYLDAHYSDYLKGWLYTELPRNPENLREKECEECEGTGRIGDLGAGGFYRDGKPNNNQVARCDSCHGSGVVNFEQNV